MDGWPLYHEFLFFNHLLDRGSTTGLEKNMLTTAEHTAVTFGLDTSALE